MVLYPESAVERTIRIGSRKWGGLKELGVRMIPAYSPKARGRSERNPRHRGKSAAAWPWLVTCQDNRAESGIDSHS